jgi:thiazole synthase
MSQMSNDPLVIAGTTLSSRIFVGSARYPNQQVMLDAMAAAQPCMVTMSIRRISLEGYAESLIDLLGDRYPILPNTAGCVTARDAILTAELAREALDTNWVKLELIGDRDLLYPDVEQLVHAADELVRKGFVVLPYCNEDPVSCQKLADVGCAAVMPLGSLIGSGRGIANPAAIELICSRSSVPVVLDAGIGTASDAAQAMELGCDAVMVDTAIAKSHDPVRMGGAMKAAVEAGRLARLAGRIPKRTFAEPSSPQLGLVGC